MSRLTYWKSRTKITRGEVKLVESVNTGLLHFLVGEKDVFRRKNGTWSCCGKECSLYHNREKDCSHIASAKLWLEGYDLKRSLRGEKDGLCV